MQLVFLYCIFKVVVVTWPPGVSLRPLKDLLVHVSCCRNWQLSWSVQWWQIFSYEEAYVVEEDEHPDSCVIQISPQALLHCSTIISSVVSPGVSKLVLKLPISMSSNPFGRAVRATCTPLRVAWAWALLDGGILEVWCRQKEDWRLESLDWLDLLPVQG